MDLKTDSYYWIKHEDDYTPIYHNYEKQWKVTIANKIRFITYAKLKSVFGKDCVVREVDFKKDKMKGTLPKNAANIMLFHYVIKSDKGSDVVVMKNNNVVLVDKMVIPSSEMDDGFYLDFNEAV